MNLKEFKRMLAKAHNVTIPTQDNFPRVFITKKEALRVANASFHYHPRIRVIMYGKCLEMGAKTGEEVTT